MTTDWEQDEESLSAQASTIVQGLLRLASSDEACRLLGVDGTLEDEVDVTFLNDPLSWIASEIANGIRLEDDESEGVSLSTLVALVRLYRALRGNLSETELREAVQQYLDEEDE
jgi:hypothetical protein